MVTELQLYYTCMEGGSDDQGGKILVSYKGQEVELTLTIVDETYDKIGCNIWGGTGQHLIISLIRIMVN